MLIPRTALLLAENAAGSLTDSGEGYLRLTWAPGLVESAVRKALFESLLTAIAERGIDRALIDQRQMAPFSADDQRWITEEWGPRVARAGYRFRAILTAADAFARLATSSMLGLQRQRIMHEFFADEAEAIAWLQAQ